MVAGRLAGASDIVALITIEYAREPNAPRLSFAVIVKLNVPAAVGVPVIAPVDVFSDKPVGNEPTNAYVYGAVPPEAVTVWLYAMFCVVAGRLAGFSVSAASTVPEYAREPVESAASVAVIVKLYAPPVVGVPLIWPVDVLSVNPAGNMPADTAYVYGPRPPDAVIVWLYDTPTAGFGSVVGEIVSATHVPAGPAVTLIAKPLLLVKSATIGVGDDESVMRMSWPLLPFVSLQLRTPLTTPADDTVRCSGSVLAPSSVTVYGPVPPLIGIVCVYATPRRACGKSSSIVMPLTV